MEKWASIIGFDGLYEISSSGNCKRLPVPDSAGRRRKEKVLKPLNTGEGYMVFYLYVNGIRHIKKAHRLVAEAFIPNPNIKPEVNHINKKRSDNSYTNLEWATSSENVKHSYDTGRIPYMLGKKGMLSPGYGKTGSLSASAKIVLCITSGQIFGSACEAARLLGIGFSQICAVCRGDRKMIKGLSFKYINNA